RPLAHRGRPGGLRPAVARQTHGRPRRNLRRTDGGMPHTLFHRPAHFPHTRRRTHRPGRTTLLPARTRLTARLPPTTAPLTAAPVSAAETAPAAQQQVETSAATFEDRILELLNDGREDKGLRPLERHDGLDDVAQAWSDRQADEGRMYHNPDFFDQYPGSP